MTTHGRACAALGLAALLASCTARDFFGYRDDAPLHVIERPENYSASAFGAKLCATYYGGVDETADLAAISGGAGTPTAFYRLSADGALVDVVDPWDTYLTSSPAAAQGTGSGASLAGLPTFEGVGFGGAPKPLFGCFAVGEPGIASVRIVCPMTGDEIDLSSYATLEAAPSGFGKELAAFALPGAASHLLAVAADSFVQVFSAPTSDRHGDALYPSFEGADDGPIDEIAAGAFADGRFFVAAAVTDEASGVPSRVHLFVQDAPSSRGASEVACLERPTEPGFGGSMAAGDLDGNGIDELIVAAGLADGRADAVHVYDVAALEVARPVCGGTVSAAPKATVMPGNGAPRVLCGASEVCDFGASLAVGDIATDDFGPELLVGAPGASVDGKKNAGAVFVYRGAELMASGTAPLAGSVADSSPSSGARFGSAVAAAPMGGRIELLVGAAGDESAFVAYCTGVGTDIDLGADVTRNARGDTVSTRCRRK